MVVVGAGIAVVAVGAGDEVMAVGAGVVVVAAGAGVVGAEVAETRGGGRTCRRRRCRSRG